jgi:hypothetical protein
MNLITDRTLLDVERWNELRNKSWVDMTELEREEWLGEITPTPSAAKGMYTHNDLNRVESAVMAISERLSELGYKHSPLTIKTDWELADDVTRGDMERYLNNIVVLRQTLAMFPNTPPVPTVNDNLTYTTANDIERILLDIDRVIANIMRSKNYVGEIMSGEV